MRIFIAGATGELGRELVRQIVSAGHEVYGLSRRRENERVLRDLGAVPRSGDLFDLNSLLRAAEGCEAVVHAATKIPTSRPRRSHFAENDRIRVEGTKNLTACANAIGARTYVQQSIIWVASPPNGSPFDEDSPVYPRWWAVSALQGERIAQAAAAHGGPDAMVFRCGGFYGPESAHLLLMRRLLARRLFPLVRRANAPRSVIHIRDAASAFVKGILSPRVGVWHVVDDAPVSMNDFIEGLARLLDAPPPIAIPGWLATLVGGPVLSSMFNQPSITSNSRLRKDFGWAPAFPTIETGLQSIVSKWRAAA